MKNLFKKIGIAFFILLVFSFTINAQELELLGAGATFPYPLYSKMFDVYHKEYGVKINYQAIGSGGGIRQLLNKTVDFGGSDAYMTDEELKESSDKILHIPICLGAVSVTYNLPDNPELKFTPEIIGNIFLGKIKKWNDSAIQKINPDKKIPNLNITIVHRSDGSGTTSIFTDYLTKINTDWAKNVGAGKSVNWPLGLGAKGNPGVAGLIKQLPGSIGYVELIYALQNNMPVGLIKNKSGLFIKPSLESTSLSANTNIPDDMRVSLTDTEAKEGYPISGFTWVLVFIEQDYNNKSKEKAKVLIDMLWWMTHQGQKYAEPLHYSPLPVPVVKKVETILKSVKYNNQGLLK